MEHTSLNGINALNVFVDKPFLQSPPDAEPNDTIWLSGELSTYYHKWNFHQCCEMIFDCNSSGIAHKHCMNMLIAEKLGI